MFVMFIAYISLTKVELALGHGRNFTLYIQSHISKVQALINLLLLAALDTSTVVNTPFGFANGS